MELRTPALENLPTIQPSLLDRTIEWAIETGKVALDTEFLPNTGLLVCASLSAREGTGVVVMAHDVEGMAKVKALVERPGITTIMHNAAADLPKLASYGIGTYDIADTMYELHWQGLRPLGLKVQAKRFLGVQMEEYEDVVWEAQKGMAREYLEGVANEEWPDPEPQLQIKPRKEKRLAHKFPSKPKPKSYWKPRWTRKPKGRGKARRMMWVKVIQGKKAVEKPAPVCPVGFDPDHPLHDLKIRLLVHEGGGSEPKVYQARNIQAKAARILADMVKEGGEEVDPTARWKGIPIGERRVVEDKYRPLGLAGLDRVPEDEWSTYAARDSDITLRMHNKLTRNRPAIELEELVADSPPNYRRVDLASIPFIVAMTTAGLKVNRQKLEKLSWSLKERMEVEQVEAWKKAKRPFNLNSGYQVAELLFVETGIAPQGNTPDGALKVDEDVLEAIKDLHPSIPHILEYRRLSKLDGTYAQGLLKVANGEGRFWPRWNGVGTEQARLTVVPNVQNQPTRDAEAKDVKGAFEPEDGFVYVGADYSQIELKVLAHISQDPKMVAAFWRGDDIHKATAMDAFLLPSMDVVTFTQRRDAKIVNFGVSYGLTPYGLVKNIPFEERDPLVHTQAWAEKFIKDYLDARPGVRKYMSDIKAFAKRYGYVQDLCGRVRWLPQVGSSQRRIRGEGERMAINMPIQSSAADIIRIAMALLVQGDGTGALDGYIKAGLVKPVLQVHDELIFEVWAPLAKEIEGLIKQVMESAAPWLSVPLTADVNSGATWAELK